MPDQYKLYFVNTARVKPGKGAEAAKWWTDKGLPFYSKMPGVKSVSVFSGQFGLCGEYHLEFWYEIEDYSVLDRWDAEMLAKGAQYAELAIESNELFEGGPNRLMGEWPGSMLIGDD